jgi:polysaccharide biosynthesis/export protein
MRMLAGGMLLALRIMAQVEPASANLPAQAIGPMDLLAISVYGAPELTRSVRVSDEGQIRLPMVRRKIDVGGSMPVEVEERIAAALIEEDILVEPAVSVGVS